MSRRSKTAVFSSLFSFSAFSLFYSTSIPGLIFGLSDGVHDATEFYFRVTAATRLLFVVFLRLISVQVLGNGTGNGFTERVSLSSLGMSRKGLCTGFIIWSSQILWPSLPLHPMRSWPYLHAASIYVTSTQILWMRESQSRLPAHTHTHTTTLVIL